jgi:hypothetical protein
VWLDRSGHRAPISQIQSSQGPAHCGRQDITFLVIDDHTAAYLVSRADAGDVERWPAATGPIGCA